MSSLKQVLKMARSAPTAPKSRNLVAASPLMKKGGLHTGEQVKSKHRKDRRTARHELKAAKWL
jgi:hypothetical protein